MASTYQPCPRVRHGRGGRPRRGGMLKNRKLARVVSDARFGEIRRQLTYKTPWNGGHLEIADVPLLQDVLGLSGSKNQTAAPDASVQLRNVWPGPGSVTAALNLAALVTRHVAGSGPATRNGRRADRKTPPRGAAGATSHQGEEASIPHCPPRIGSDGDLRPATANHRDSPTSR